MTRRFAFEPAARDIYLALRKDPEGPMYVAVRQVLSALLENPGARNLRRLSYRPNTWGVPVRSGDVRWLVLWRSSESDPELIEIHYIGPEPGESEARTAQGRQLSR